MSARIFMHPRIKATELAGFLEEYDRMVLISDGVIESFPKLGEELTEADTPAVVFECLRCEWTGTEPEYVDTCDFFEPPRGAVPQCPECGDFNLKLHLKDRP